MHQLEPQRKRPRERERGRGGGRESPSSAGPGFSVWKEVNCCVAFMYAKACWIGKLCGSCRLMMSDYVDCRARLVDFDMML